VTIEEILFIKPGDVCNLGRVPISRGINPFVQSVRQIIENCDIHYTQTYAYSFFKKAVPVNNLSEFYGFDDSTLKKIPSNQIFLPWIHNKPVSEYTDDDFFGSKDDQYLRDLIEKLKKLTLSIQESGYRPNLYPDRKEGHITGYFLQSEEKEKFYVVSGNHRVSVLSGIDECYKIPVIHERCAFLKERDKANNTVYKRHCTWRRWLRAENSATYPKLFTSNDIGNWPSVKEGFLTKVQAMKIFDVYISGP